MAEGTTDHHPEADLQLPQPQQGTGPFQRATLHGPSQRAVPPVSGSESDAPDPVQDVGMHRSSRLVAEERTVEAVDLRNSRMPSNAQVDLIAQSIAEFGCTNQRRAVVIPDNRVVLQVGQDPRTSSPLSWTLSLRGCGNRPIGRSSLRASTGSIIMRRTLLADAQVTGLESEPPGRHRVDPRRRTGRNGARPAARSAPPREAVPGPPLWPRGR